MGALCVLAFTFISLQIRISEIKDNLGVELAGNRSPSLTDLVVQSVQIQWGWPLLTIGAVFILCAAAVKFVSVPAGLKYPTTHPLSTTHLTSDPMVDDPSIFTYMCPKCHSFQRSEVVTCPKCGVDNPHRTRSFSHSSTREDPDEYLSAIQELNGLIGLRIVKHEIETLIMSYACRKCAKPTD
jgi:hypothetical protein